jgi:hypothetical protein
VAAVGDTDDAAGNHCLHITSGANPNDIVRVAGGVVTDLKRD